jgi:hypothetical protein
MNKDNVQYYPQRFMKLPVATVFMDLEFNLVNMTKPYFDGNKIPHYIASVHYVERDGERQYFLEYDKIKRLVKVEYDYDGYDFVSAIYHYGVKQ